MRTAPSGSAVLFADSLSKSYRIGDGPAYETLRDTISRLVTLRRRSPQEEIWALREVSFEIREGETVGLVGHNGAGKSTLLKILSRVTEPSDGRVGYRGRVGSLLEVGAGFHPELTGRDNIYLNASILGMSRRETRAKLDAIVDFAEIRPFLDTPVKHYSSGMYVRLAFAVAAHLEPDILLVDEVLAVGDSRFWSKSIERMQALNSRGMTIVLVTHNMWLIQSFCRRALCLEKGRLVADGDPLTAIARYRSFNPPKIERSRHTEISERTAEITTLAVEPVGQVGTHGQAHPRSGLRVHLAARVQGVESARFLIRVTSPDGLPYFTTYSDPQSLRDGRMAAIADFERLMLMPGSYVVWGGVCCGSETREDIITTSNCALHVEAQVAVKPEVSLFLNEAEWHYGE